MHLVLAVVRQMYLPVIDCPARRLVAAFDILGALLIFSERWIVRPRL